MGTFKRGSRTEVGLQLTACEGGGGGGETLHYSREQRGARLRP